MPDRINLLPDSIANKIAAGEVVQRPASVVKELLENSLDAGATQIKLVINDAGRSLIQVIDNGMGMSDTDARMCFERHATSKIREAEDLFSIQTMGFRGEALASISAVAQVEMRTRTAETELGTKIIIEGSKLKTHEPCQCIVGTNLSIKNLFFNVPARRNFLKSAKVEFGHIQQEFLRIALANPAIFFSMHNNGKEIFHLQAGNQRQRAVNALGGNFNPKLVPVEEATDILKVNGFIGKPETSRKTRGDQYFFVNKRFIKSAYLHKAVMMAYEGLISADSYPFYLLHLEIDPAKIDINVHPTKQEIKFEDEKLVFNYLKVSLRHALGRHNIMPTLDFDQESSFSQNFGSQQLPSQQSSQEDSWTIPSKMNGDGHGEGYRSSNTPRTSSSRSADGSVRLSSAANHAPTDQERERMRNNKMNWEKLYEGLEEFDELPSASDADEELPEGHLISASSQMDEEQGLESFVKKVDKKPYQLHGVYIVSPIKSGYVLIDQQSAHERILYEQYRRQQGKEPIPSQKELFPRTVELSTIDAEVMRAILPDVNQLGFEVEEFGNSTFVIHGIPADMRSLEDANDTIDLLLEQYKLNLDLQLDTKENIARTMARSAAIKRGTQLTEVEMQKLIDELFACEMPFTSPYGKKCFITYNLEDLEKKFKASL